MNKADTGTRPLKSINSIFLGILVSLFIVVFLILILRPMRFVPENQYAVQRRFSKVVDTRNYAGLMLVAPFIDSVSFLPKNDQIYDPDPSQVLTKDKKAMDVDSYCIWRINNPMAFIINLNDLDKAQRRLDATIYNATKNTLSALTQEEILAEREGALDKTILGICIPNMESYGIELLSVTIKQFALPEDNLNAVYTRMISERNQIAAQYRAEGLEDGNKVRNTADKEVRLILASANANAAKIEAEGESEYMRILSEAYSGSERAEFYRFMRSIDALKATMKGSTSIILPYDSPLGQWFVGYETVNNGLVSSGQVAED